MPSVWRHFHPLAPLSFAKALVLLAAWYLCVPAQPQPQPQYQFDHWATSEESRKKWGRLCLAASPMGEKSLVDELLRAVYNPGF